MLFNIAQLISLFSLFLWASSKLTKNRIFLYSVVAVFAFLLTLEASSVYLINQPFGYQYWVNVNFEDIQVYIFQFYAELVYAGFFLILVFVLLVYSARKISAYKNTYWIKYQWTTPIACLALLSLPNGVFHSILDIARIQFIKPETVERALADIGINPNEYVFPGQLKASPGKNIVVISAESFEKGFLNHAYGDVAPRLRDLKKDFNYSGMLQNGASWTVGSIYSVFTGIPAVFKTRDNGNYIFSGINGLNFTTLGNVLSEAGYNMRYLMADAHFNGTNDLLKVNHFEIITNKPGMNMGKFNSMNDLDLFSEAKIQILDLKNKNKPFALFISTINSHFPNGIYDPRMEKYILKNKLDFKNEVDYSVMATDYLIGDFIDYLKKNKLLENTVFYIYPDHLMMGSGNHILKLNELGRELYVLTNADLKKFKEIGQLNLPRMIIDGAGIKSNAKFLVDFIENKNIKDSRLKFAKLNSSILNIEDHQGQLMLSLESDSLVLNIPNKNFTNILKLNQGDTWANFLFNSNFKFIKASSGNGKFNPIDTDSRNLSLPIYLTVLFEGQKIKKWYLGNYKDVGIFEHLSPRSSKVSISNISISNFVALNTSIGKEDFYSTPLLTYKTNFGKFPEVIEVTSSEFKSLYSNAPSRLRVGNSEYTVSGGLNLLHIQDNGRLNFSNYLISKSADVASKLTDKLIYLKQKKLPFIIFSSDSISNHWPGYQDALMSIQLEKLSSLNGRFAYIGYFDGFVVKEFSNSSTISKSFPLFKEYRVWTPPSAIPLSEYLLNKDRFIAHGGGKINGKTYTNSLDALNNSYRNGFRLFELDIIKTADNVYVASHDWSHWALITGYKGPLPPSHKEFMRHKIYGNFEPLDISRINDWFKTHSDAILITDKVNEPKKFASSFVDKSRLKMELFSVDAVLEAIEFGILEAIPNSELWTEISQNYEELIANKKLRYFAGPRTMNKEILSQLVDAGMKVYAYQLNFNPSANEKWVICNERNLFYGIYADDFQFFKMNECTKSN